jgi:Zn-finger nucleic acid-binding protein
MMKRVASPEACLQEVCDVKCPVDGTTLVMSERQGVEIDYCPDCRGVWLDRGELDKIIERADDELDREPPRPEREERGRDRGDYREYREERHQRPHKKRSFFSEMFEGFGGGDD